MQKRQLKILKPIAVIVLFSFLWTFGGFCEIAYAVKNSDKQSAFSHQPKQQKPEEKFEKAIEDIEQILADAGTDTDTKKDKLRIKKLEVESFDAEIRKQFKETEEKIKNLPDVIKQRHRDFVKRYEENLNTLRTNLDDIDRAKTEEEKEQAHRKVKEFLEKVKPPKKYIPLDPNKLPHRTAEPVFKEPRLKPEEFESDHRHQTTD